LAGPTARGPDWLRWRTSTPPCLASPPSRRTYTSVTVTHSLRHGCTPKLPDRRLASPNATTSRDRRPGSTRSCAVVFHIRSCPGRTVRSATNERDRRDDQFNLPPSKAQQRGFQCSGCALTATGRRRGLRGACTSCNQNRNVG